MSPFRGFVAIGLISLGRLLAATDLARASDRDLDLGIASCGRLSPTEVRRIVLLEMQSLSPVSWRAALELDIRCAKSGDGEVVHIHLHETKGGRRLERTIPAPSEEDPGRERVIALAASQLIVALGWVTSDAAPAEPLPAAEKAAPAVTLQDTGAPVVSPQASMLGVGVGGRARHLTSPAVSWRGVVAFTSPIAYKLSADLRGSFESTKREKLEGAVVFRSVSAHAGLRPVLLSQAGFELFTRAALGVSYLQVKGSSEGADFESSTRSGLGFDPEVGLGLSFGERLALGIELEAGYLLPKVEGRVAGDSPARFGGAWAGGLVSVKAGF